MTSGSHSPAWSGLEAAVAAAVSAFGAAIAGKFASGLTASPEDQMRAPLEGLLAQARPQRLG